MELLEKFQNLEENIKVLKQIKNEVPFEALNKRVEWEIRYGLLESIQIIIDISCKLATSYNLGKPSNYKECVKLLIKYDFLDKALGEKIVSMVGLRNLLVHEYAIIENEKLYDFLNSIDDFSLFIEQIRKTLKGSNV